jgi:uncharacterized protein
MTLKELLEKALLDAMKKNDANKKNVIRLVLTGVKLSEAEKGTKLEDQAIVAIIQKEIKQHQETIDGAKKANRDDLVKQAEAEIKELTAFLPKQMSTEEIISEVKQAIAGKRDKRHGKSHERIIAKNCWKSA